MSGSDVFKAGWLTKKGGSGAFANWKKRWAVLNNNKLLSYYVSPQDTKPKGTVDLSEFDTCTLLKDSSAPLEHVFALVTENEKSNKFVMCVETSSDMVEWLSAIRSVMDSDGITMKITANEDQQLNEYTNPPDAVRIGWLLKVGYRVENWKRRWCVLTKNKQLQYFVSKDSTRPQGTIDLQQYNYCTETDAAQQKGQKNGFFLMNWELSKAQQRIYYFGADTKEHMEDWVKSINEVLASEPEENTTEKARVSPRISINVRNQVRESVGSLRINTMTMESRKDVPVVKNGWFFKCPATGPESGNWKKRWFELGEDHKISYSRGENEKSLGLFDLHICDNIEKITLEGVVFKNALKFSCDHDNTKRVYYMASSDISVINDFLNEINISIGMPTSFQSLSAGWLLHSSVSGRKETGPWYKRSVSVGKGVISLYKCVSQRALGTINLISYNACMPANMPNSGQVHVAVLCNTKDPAVQSHYFSALSASSLQLWIDIIVAEMDRLKKEAETQLEEEQKQQEVNNAEDTEQIPVKKEEEEEKEEHKEEEETPEQGGNTLRPQSVSKSINPFKKVSVKKVKKSTIENINENDIQNETKLGDDEEDTKFDVEDNEKSEGEASDEELELPEEQPRDGPALIDHNGKEQNSVLPDLMAVDSTGVHVHRITSETSQIEEPKSVLDKLKDAVLTRAESETSLGFTSFMFGSMAPTAAPVAPVAAPPAIVAPPAVDPTPTESETLDVEPNPPHRASSTLDNLLIEHKDESRPLSATFLHGKVDYQENEVAEQPIAPPVSKPKSNTPCLAVYDLYCSWCLQKDGFDLYQTFSLKRNTIKCRHCENLALPCRLCKVGAARQLPDGTRENLCGKCDGWLPEWHEIRAPGHCSWCYNYVDQRLIKRHTLSRDLFQCTNCFKDTCLCNTCTYSDQKAAFAKCIGDDFHDECALCSGEIQYWDS